jgi:hypothetical protein
MIHMCNEIGWGEILVNECWWVVVGEEERGEVWFMVVWGGGMALCHDFGIFMFRDGVV